MGDLEERGRWVKREAWRGRGVVESPCLPIPLTTTWPCVPSTPRLTPCANPCSITHAFALLASAHPCQPKDQLDALMAINKPKPSHFTTSTTPPHSLTPPSLACLFALYEQSSPEPPSNPLSGGPSSSTSPPRELAAPVSCVVAASAVACARAWPRPPAASATSRRRCSTPLGEHHRSRVRPNWNLIYWTQAIAIISN